MKSSNKEDWSESILWRSQLPLHSPIGRYPGFSPMQDRLPAGTTYAKGGRKLTVDLLKDQDTAVAMRDGIILYADIFRPAGWDDKLPTIVAWSPYGKGNGGNQSLDDFPFRAGVAPSRLSGLQAWEGPDPARWCELGYAIVNVDTRGAFNSEGRGAIWGTQEGRDGYDLIEWIARQPWSNGRIGLSGNSWLAIAQWFIAAERPPHLAAIAPWEGFCDVFRHSFQGGIVDTAFAQTIFDVAVGRGELENFSAMARQEPLMTAYWRDKNARVEDIDVPTYVVASWTNFLHTPGTLDAWRRLRSQRRWLRVHNSMEWPDYYSDRAQAELHSFFDRYLKSLDNNWELTPRVRVAVLGREGHDEIDRPLSEFPPPGVLHKTLYLDPSGRTLQLEELAAPAVLTCKPGESICFDLSVDSQIEIIGFSALRLWVELKDSNDQDIFVALERFDSRSRQIACRTIPIPNRWLAQALRFVHRLRLIRALNLLFPTAVKGRLRMSHRELDSSLSTPDRPVLTHSRELPVAPGAAVPVDIAIDPVAMRLEPRESLRLRISGRDLSPIPLANVKSAPPCGSGQFSIWCGGPYDSRLLAPVS